jgi:hypothetical protein
MSPQCLYPHHARSDLLSLGRYMAPAAGMKCSSLTRIHAMDIVCDVRRKWR